MKKIIKTEIIIVLLMMLNTCGRPQAVTIEYDQVLSAAPVYFGWEGGWINEDSSLFLERYQITRPNIIRIQIPMFSFEPVNDNSDPNLSTINFNVNSTYDLQYNRSVNYDQFLRKILNQHPDIAIYINIWDCANWLATTPGTFMGGISGAFPPTDYNEYKEFIRATAFWLMDSVGFRPEKILFTFVNEPNSNASFPTHAYVGDVNDLLLMAQAAHEALAQVSPLIRMGGIEEWMNTSLTQDFLSQNGGQYLDFLTFHVYQIGVEEVNTAITEITDQLTPYGLPVYLTEMGDNAYGAYYMINYNSIHAGLALTRNLINIWRLPLSGFTMFRLNNTYLDNPFYGLNGWIGYGLFEDWRGTHTNGQAYQLFPGFWSFANFYNYLDSCSVVKTDYTLSGIDILAGKRDSSVVMVAVNSNTDQAQNLDISINTSSAKMFNHYYSFNGLTGTAAIDSASFDSNRFSYSLPAQSVRFLLITQDLFSAIPESHSENSMDRRNYILDAYPNPFNSTLTIRYSVPFPQSVQIRVLDVLGRPVLSMDTGNNHSSPAALDLDMSSVSSGIYFVILSGNSFSISRKIALLK